MSSIFRPGEINQNSKKRKKGIDCATSRPHESKFSPAIAVFVFIGSVEKRKSQERERLEAGGSLLCAPKRELHSSEGRGGEGRKSANAGTRRSCEEQHNHRSDVRHSVNVGPEFNQRTGPSCL